MLDVKMMRNALGGNFDESAELFMHASKNNDACLSFPWIRIIVSWRWTIGTSGSAVDIFHASAMRTCAGDPKCSCLSQILLQFMSFITAEANKAISVCMVDFSMCVKFPILAGRIECVIG
jgi:hypothetical protein